jgi:putative ABC transport system permease protein
MPILLLARRQLRSHGARAALTAAGIACGVALVVAIEVINASTLGAFTDAIDDLAGTAALQVRGRGDFSEEVAERLRDLPGVEHAVPILTDTFFVVDGPAANEALSVFAADVTDGHAIKTLRLVRSGDSVVDDPLSFFADPASVILTDVFARRLDAHVGTTLQLRTPVGIRTFTVRGILKPGGVGRAFGGNLLLMDVIGAQAVLGRDRKIDQVDIVLAPQVDVDRAEAAVRAVLPPGIDVLRPARRGEQIERILRSYRTLLSGISGLALLAAVFVVASAVSTSVAARRQQIGLLRCVGATRRHVLRLVLGEAALLGAVGTGVGILLGLILARLLLDTVTESAELVFSVRLLRSALDVSPGAIALGAAAGLVTTLAAALLPARAAAAISPLVAVRTATPGPVARRWPAPGVLLGTTLLAGAALAAQVWLDSGWAGNVAAVATDVALVCLFMRLAGRLSAIVLGPLRGRLGFADRMAVDRLTRIPDQLALAGAVLALGLGLMLMAGTLSRSFEESVLDFIHHQVRADLVVASTASTGWIESPLPESIGERLAALPGVARVERARLAEHEFRGERISIDSLDASAFGPDRRSDFVFVAGDPDAALAAVRRGDAVLVSRNFARLFDVGVGTRLALDTPTGRYEPTVAGVVVDYVSPRGSVIIARDTWTHWWNDHTVNRFLVSLAPGTTGEKVRSAIAADVGREEGLKVLTQRELYAYHQDAVRRAFRFTHALEVLPLVVAALGLAEALLAVALDRRRELALLRAAGTTRGQIARSVVAEAAGVGMLGLVGGLAMGGALSVLWVRVNFAYQLGWDLDLHFALGGLPVAVLAAALVSVPAGLLPARHIARLPVLDALRDE